MHPFRDEDIEAEARALLHKTILRSGWYPELPEGERERYIEQDVERHWHLMRDEAASRLGRQAHEDQD